MSDFYISCRTDRYGSRSIPWLCAIYTSNLYNKKLYHDCNKHCNMYKNSILHNYLITNSYTSCDKNQMIKHNDWLWESNFVPNWVYKNKMDDSKQNQVKYSWGTRQIIEEIYRKNNTPFPEQFFNSKCYSDLRFLFEEKYKDLFESTYKEEIHKIKNSVIIHVRLDDMKKGQKGNNNSQCFIGEDNLINLMQSIFKQFKLPIYLMTNNDESDKMFLINILSEINTEINIDDSSINNHVLGNDDEEFDIYIMCQGKHLFTSSSTFGFISALLHNNTCYSTKKWGHFNDLTGDKISEKYKLYLNF